MNRTTTPPLRSPGRSNHRKLAVLVVAVTLSAAALAMSPTPVPWGYPALDALCLLQEAAAVDGVPGAYPIGSTVETKFGKWSCTKVVVNQSPVRTGGVWVQK